MQQVNTMSLAATAAISPYQRTVHSFSASNDLLSIAMAQQINSTIIKGYSNGMQKNSREIKKIQEQLKRAEDRKRTLMRLNRYVMQNKEEWKQSQLSQALKNQQKSYNHMNNQNNNDNLNNNQNQQSDLQNNMQNMQKQVQQMQDMMMNMQSHIMAKDDDNDSKSDGGNPETEELREWLEDVVKLPQYFDAFVENGFEDLQSMSYITKDELTQMKITKLGHQVKIIGEIQKLNN